MTRVVVDASALAALAFGEPDGPRIARVLDGAAVFAPRLLPFELANTAVKKARRHPADAARILMALATVLDPRWGLRWQDVSATDVALLAQTSGLSAYDASYVWLAGALSADLVTLDARLARASLA